MTVYDNLEKWKDGSIRYVERYAKGTKDSNGKSIGGRYKEVTYKNSKGHKFYNGEKVGIWNKEPQQKIVTEIEHGDYVKGDFYRASISLNVPYHGTKTHPNYINFTYVVIDELKNIDINQMYEEFMQQMEDKSQLGYLRDEFIWFDHALKDCDIQNPKPYSARKSSMSFEGM